MTSEISMGEIRRLARMMNCPQCNAAGGRIWEGKWRNCAFCGGDKIIPRKIFRQIAREHGYTEEKMQEELGA